MKHLKTIALAATALLLVSVGTGNAWADRDYHRRPSSRVGIYFGPTWGPMFYPPPIYYPPSPPIIIERAPPVYIEQPPPVTVQRQSSNYWYYCDASNSYYPYVKECPSGWQRVSPSPAGEP